MPIFTKLLKYPFQGQFAGDWRWPKDVSNTDWATVEIPSVSGSHLVAIFGKAEGDPVGTVLLAHPLGRTAKGFWLKHGHANYFRRLGFHVLAIDFNGFGKSPDHTFNFPLDVIASAKWLKANYPDLPTGAVGASFGAAWIVCAMARHNLFDAVLIESTFSSLSDFWRKYPLPHVTLKFSKVILPRLELSMRPEHAAQRVVGSPNITLLYSKTDRHTPLANGEALLRALPPSVSARLLVADKADHTHIFRDAPDTYASAAQAFKHSMTSWKIPEQNRKEL